MHYEIFHISRIKENKTIFRHYSFKTNEDIGHIITRLLEFQAFWKIKEDAIGMYTFTILPHVDQDKNFIWI